MLEDGRPIGRVHEEHAPSHPELAWTWSILVVLDPRAKVLASGKASTLEQAKADFRANWAVWKEWAAARRQLDGFDS